MSRDQEMIEINLNAPNTPEERQLNIAGNVCLGKGEKYVPFIDYDEAACEASHQHKLNAWSATATTEEDGKPRLRFYAVGPSTCHIACPLCKKRADSETVQMSGILGQLSCLLSSLSCCFPIFSLSLVYMCLQSRFKSKRLFCNKCGGYLGYYWRPS